MDRKSVEALSSPLAEALVSAAKRPLPAVRQQLSDLANRLMTDGVTEQDVMASLRETADDGKPDDRNTQPSAEDKMRHQESGSSGTSARRATSGRRAAGMNHFIDQLPVAKREEIILAYTALMDDHIDGI